MVCTKGCSPFTLLLLLFFLRSALYGSVEHKKIILCMLQCATHMWHVVCICVPQQNLSCLWWNMHVSEPRPHFSTSFLPHSALLGQGSCVCVCLCVCVCCIGLKRFIRGEKESRIFIFPRDRISRGSAVLDVVALACHPWSMSHPLLLLLPFLPPSGGEEKGGRQGGR